jgi:hypothetical protein
MKNVLERVTLFKQAARELFSSHQGLQAYTVIPPVGESLDVTCMVRYLDRKAFYNQTYPSCMENSPKLFDEYSQEEGVIEFGNAAHFER